MKEAKSSLKRRFQRWLITKTLMLLIRITGNTTRIKSNNQQILKTTLQEYGSVIVATWHQNIYFSVWLLRNQKLTALISNSDDGEVIYDVFAHFGYQAVRGSTTRGGIPALKKHHQKQCRKQHSNYCSTDIQYTDMSVFGWVKKHFFTVTYQSWARLVSPRGTEARSHACSVSRLGYDPRSTLNLAEAI